MHYFDSYWLRYWTDSLGGGAHPHVSAFALPELSAENQPIHALRIGTGPADGRAVLLVGGMHGDELLPPHLLLSFAARLAAAYAARGPLTFRARSYPFAVVSALIESLRIYVLPLVNPDGRDYALSVGGDPSWRKNRRLIPGTGQHGVDINRNFGFLWEEDIGDFTRDPASETYEGPAAFSESETRNVRFLLDQHPEIGCFIDVHSGHRAVFYPWGHDTVQTTNPAMSFHNPAYASHGGSYYDGYEEYMPPDDLARYQRMATRIADGMRSHRGRSAQTGPASDAYFHAGTGRDYAYSRHLADAGRPKILGFVMELDFNTQPQQDEEAEAQVIEGSIGLTEALLDFLCPAETASRMSGAAPGAVPLFRRLRAEVLAPDERGRRLARFFDEHRGELTRLLLGQAERASSWRTPLAAASAAAEKMLRREPVTLDAEALSAVGAAVAALEDAGSPALRAALGELRDYILQLDTSGGA
jgi:murein tripeptide amidase MpaA